MKIAADFSNLESQKEFVRQYCQHCEEEPWLPMLTSACPGWDRYAECIMDSLVKDYFIRRQNLSPDKILHVIVALCYDKKLEALREDVPTALHSSHGADCMLTSGEIVQKMEPSDLALNDATVDTLFGDMKEKEVRLHYGTWHTSSGTWPWFNEDVGVLTYPP
ncbi:hypothetical protein QTO34_014621 [Cnephaeus nilssonii]|uniref:Iron hydrogenase large subunit C-terminal domain-containing protein n=1 Tax=Cnephaeus nilssonii TaxID=3371016 RepID=A0AA40I6P6_CNENI|nr:hypothetical protein QTO34_014621 [Eptesicus nilssonii]